MTEARESAQVRTLSWRRTKAGIEANSYLGAIYRIERSRNTLVPDPYRLRILNVYSSMDGVTFANEEAARQAAQDDFRKMVNAALLWDGTEALPPDEAELLREAAAAGRELAGYASYAEIVGAVGHNREPIRKWCDEVFRLGHAIDRLRDEEVEDLVDAPETGDGGTTAS